MRAGARRNDWQLDEVRYLLDNAGRVPKHEICRKLRRSSKSVEHMASRLRSQGYAISLRCYQSQAVTCPSCGRSSLTARETGICRPCTLCRRLAATEGQISDLLRRLPADVRSIYEDTEAEKGTRIIDPMPKMPTYAEPPDPLPEAQGRGGVRQGHGGVGGAAHTARAQGRAEAQGEDRAQGARVM